MKILIYGINFAPELTGIGKYTGEMAAWLVNAGHEVRVITAPPYYPDWKVSSGYRSTHYRKDIVAGSLVFRVPVWIPEKPSGIKRILHLVSFAVSSLPVLLAQWRWRPDMVWVVEPPLFCAFGAAFFARSRGSKSWIHIQDFEVDAAFDLGILKGRFLKKAVSFCESWLMRRFDRVSTISDRMLARALGKGVDSLKLISFPNWVDISAIVPLNHPSIYRSRLDIATDEIVALYSGNMGGKQGLEILAEVATALRTVKKLIFVFCGNGSGRDELVERCAGLTNVRFLDLQPLENLNELLGLADIHLLPQRLDAADLVMPSKLTGMLASGRPVVATARMDTELGRVVSTCGITVPPENVDALAEAIMDLFASYTKRILLGKAARHYAISNLDSNSVLRKFELDALELCGMASDDCGTASR